MDLLVIILFVAAIGLFAAAGFTIPRGDPPNIHLGWFGMVALAVALWIHVWS